MRDRKKDTSLEELAGDRWMNGWIEELVREAAELNDWMRGLKLTDKQASHPIRLRGHARMDDVCIMLVWWDPLPLNAQPSVQLYVTL